MMVAFTENGELYLFVTDEGELQNKSGGDPLVARI